MSNINKVHPPICKITYSTCNSATVPGDKICFHDLIQMKNGLLSGGLNQGPLGHESSALPLDHKFPLLFQCLNFEVS